MSEIEDLRKEFEDYKKTGYWGRRDVLKSIGTGLLGIAGAGALLSNPAEAGSLGFDISGTVPKLKQDLDFNHYKSIAMVCDNGTTFPLNPGTGQWFLHTPTGRKILMMYDGSNWIPIISLGSMAMFVETVANGGNDANGGTSSGDAFATLQKAINTIPGLVGGNVTINVGVGNFNNTVVIQGKNYSGAYTITIQGTLPAASVTGTATSGGAYSMGAAGYGAIQAVLNDTGKTWTVGTIADSGTTTSTVATKLVQTGQNFLTTVKVGMTVKNTTDDTWTQVVRVENDTTLLLRDDIMTTTEGFEIGWGQYTGCLLVITGGTGIGQERVIDSNTKTALRIAGTWDTTPDNTSTYAIYNLSTGGTTIDRTAGSLNIEYSIEQTGQKSVIYKYLNIIEMGLYGIYLHDSSNATITSCRFAETRAATAGFCIQADSFSTITNLIGCSFDLGAYIRGLRLQNGAMPNAITAIKNSRFLGGGAGTITCAAMSYTAINVGLLFRSVSIALGINSWARFDIQQTIITGCTGGAGISLSNGGYIIFRQDNEISSNNGAGILLFGLSSAMVANPGNQSNYNNGYGEQSTNLSIGTNVSYNIGYTGNVSGTYTADATSVNT